MGDVCGCVGVMSCLTSCHVMTKEDIMVCKMIGKIGEKWVVSLHLKQIVRLKAERYLDQWACQHVSILVVEKYSKFL
jgi:hypothetical protein